MKFLSFGLVVFLWLTHFSTYALPQPASLAQSTNLSAELLPSSLAERDPFIWYPDRTHKIVFHRKPRRQGEPQGISFYNWDQAVGQAGSKAVTMARQAHLGLDALIPGNQFEFANRLTRHTGGHTWSETRLVKYVFYGCGNTDLRFADVHLLLIELMHYGKNWAKPTQDNIVRMCLLTMYRLNNDGVESVFANGATTLIVAHSEGLIAAS